MGIIYGRMMMTKKKNENGERWLIIDNESAKGIWIEKGENIWGNKYCSS